MIADEEIASLSIAIRNGSRSVPNELHIAVSQILGAWANAPDVLKIKLLNYKKEKK